MIFITGSNGLIGSFIIRKLVSENGSIRALHRKDSNLDMLKDIAHKIEWVEGDISDIGFLDKNLKGVNTVIHAAAVVSYTPSEKKKMFHVNIDGTANIVNASLNNKVKNFIHISSVAALGRKKNSPVVDEKIYWENSTYNTNYAVSKYLAELEVWRGMEEGLNGVIVNPSVVFGPGDWNSGSTKIFKYLWEENNFYTRGEMNFIDVRDVAEIIYRLLNEQKGFGERFILNSIKMPYKEVFFKIADEFGKKRPKFEASAIVSEMAWRMEALRALFTNKNPLITKETARLSRHSFMYDNGKISNLLNYKFIQPEETIQWVCRELIKKYEKLY